MEDQTELVGWWERKVTPRLHNKVSAVHGTLSMEEAENLTLLRNQQVSKWRRRLKEPEKSRLLILVFLGPSVQVIYNLSGAAEKGSS